MSLTSRRTVMARKRYKPEEIVAKLRQVDVLVSQGQGMTEAIRQIGVSEVTYYRWRQEPLKPSASPPQCSDMRRNRSITNFQFCNCGSFPETSERRTLRGRAETAPSPRRVN